MLIDADVCVAVVVYVVGVVDQDQLADLSIAFCSSCEISASFERLEIILCFLNRKV